MRALLALLLLSTAASAQPTDNPVAMATGAHLKAVCSRSDDRASRIICLSWLNGASQGNGWFTPRDSTLTPAHCPPSRNFDLAASRGLILAWLDKHPADLARPSIEVFSRTMAARHPCKRR
jgi:Rap1a immunity proteins